MTDDFRNERWPLRNPTASGRRKPQKIEKTCNLKDPEPLDDLDPTDEAARPPERKLLKKTPTAPKADVPSSWKRMLQTLEHDPQYIDAVGKRLLRSGASRIRNAPPPPTAAEVLDDIARFILGEVPEFNPRKTFRGLI